MSPAGPMPEASRGSSQSPARRQARHSGPLLRSGQVPGSVQGTARAATAAGQRGKRSLEMTFSTGAEGAGMSHVVRNRAPAPTKPNSKTTRIRLALLMGETANSGFEEKRTVACLDSLEKSGSPLAVIFDGIDQRSTLFIPPRFYRSVSDPQGSRISPNPMPGFQHGDPLEVTGEQRDRAREACIA